MTGDLPRPRPRLPSGRTPNEYVAQFDVWAAAARGEGATSAQHPIDDVLGEHHFLRRVLIGMQTEAYSLAAKGPWHMDFWSGAVDVVGNFGLLLHWRKKANHLFPLIRPLGFAEAIEKFDRQQQLDIETTLDICDAVAEGDSEKVVRLVSLFTDSKRRHMAQEEEEVLVPARAALDVDSADKLRSEFDQVDDSALPGADRRHYLETAEKILAAIDIEEVRQRQLP